MTAFRNLLEWGYGRPGFGGNGNGYFNPIKRANYYIHSWTNTFSNFTRCNDALREEFKQWLIFIFSRDNPSFKYNENSFKNVSHVKALEMRHYYFIVHYVNQIEDMDRRYVYAKALRHILSGEGGNFRPEIWDQNTRL